MFQAVRDHVPTVDKARYAHGRSEVWLRPALKRAIEREKRLLGARLRELRIERKLNQEQAAEAMGIHAKHLQRIEAGTQNVTIATLVAASMAYKVSPAALFEKAGPESALPRTAKRK